MGIKYKVVDYKFDSVKFGNDVKRARVSSGMTQADLAFVIDPSADGSSMSGLETARYVPSMARFVALVNVFDLDPRDYFGLEG